MSSVNGVPADQDLIQLTPHQNSSESVNLESAVHRQDGVVNNNPEIAVGVDDLHVETAEGVDAMGQNPENEEPHIGAYLNQYPPPSHGTLYAAPATPPHAVPNLARVEDLYDDPFVSPRRPLISQGSIRYANSKRGCVVVINKLPPNVDIKDILPRVRGGAVAKATLVNDKNGLSTAVITFQKSDSAELYAALCQQFGSIILGFEPSNAVPGPHNIIYVGQASYIGEMPSTFQNDPADIINCVPRLFPDNASRCLIIEKCPLDLIPTVWHAMQFPHRLQSPHYRAQIEDVWFDTITTDATGRTAFVNLHIWFTSIEMAYNAMLTAQRNAQLRDAPGFAKWYLSMKFEDDPCGADKIVIEKLQTKLKDEDAKDPEFVWHSHPHTSLMGLYDLKRVDAHGDFILDTRGNMIPELDVMFRVWRGCCCPLVNGPVLTAAAGGVVPDGMDPDSDIPGGAVPGLVALPGGVVSGDIALPDGAVPRRVALPGRVARPRCVALPGPLVPGSSAVLSPRSTSLEERLQDILRLNGGELVLNEPSLRVYADIAAHQARHGGPPPFAAHQDSRQAALGTPHP